MLAWVVTVGRRVRSNREQDAVRPDHRLRVPIALVAGIEPTKVGVDAAAQTILAGAETPDYLPRAADTELRAAVSAALDGDGRWLVVVVGRPKVGKSRALLEAVKRSAKRREVELVAPVDGEALLSLLAPGELSARRPAQTVLWLDDLEPFLDQGVTLQTLREWHAAAPAGSFVAATYSGVGAELFEGPNRGAPATLASEVLREACKIALESTSPAELGQLRAVVSPRVFEALERYGLAAYLVAAPALEQKLTTCREDVQEPECPQGAAVVYAAVDWVRCGRTDPMADEVLRDLWADYLAPGLATSEAAFAAGLEWALRPVAGSIALLQSAAGHRPYDYIVRFVRDRPGTRAPPEGAWAAAIAGAEGAQALTVGMSAYLQDRYEDAVAAWTTASRSSTAAVASVAGGNLGVIRGERERSPASIASEPASPEDEIQSSAEAPVDHGEGPERQTRSADELRETAEMLLDAAIDLGQAGRSEEAIAVYDNALARFGDAPELREHAAMALLYKGALLGHLGRSEDEMVVYQCVAARFGDAPDTKLREAVARALLNMGITLHELGRTEEAITVYAGAAARLADAPEPELRRQAAKVLLNMGITLNELGRSQEAIVVSDDAIARFGDGSEPHMREQVAKALVNKGVALGELERYEDEIAAYDDVMKRFGDAAEPRLLEHVARTLVNKGIRRGQLGHYEDEIAAYDDVVARFGDAAEPKLREPVARALVNKGITLYQLQRTEEAVAAYAEAVARFGDAPDPELREPVARALVHQAISLRALGRSEDAILACDAVVERFGAASEPELREQVARARSARPDP